jgi:hypothetical protein
MKRALLFVCCFSAGGISASAQHKFVAVVSPLLAQSAGLTDQELFAAIDAVNQPGWSSLFVEAKGRFGADYSVLLQGPIGRTMDLAREAFESYKPLAAVAVPAETRAHAVTLTIVRHSGAPGIKNVVLMPPGATSRGAAIQPLPSLRLRAGDNRPRTWRPGAHAPLGFPQFYRFAENELPQGDLQIIVVTESGEQRYTVKTQERDGIR